MNFSELLATQVERGASDIHLHVGLPPLARVNGRLSPIGEAKLTPAFTEKLVDVMCDERQKRAFQEKFQVDLAYSVPGLARFRTNLFRQRGSVSAVMRVITSDEERLKVVNLPQDTIDYVRDKEQGIVLVTGPTGSGKTTTLAGALDQLNTIERKLISIEDPVEYQIEGVNQIAVNAAIGLTFASVLRSVLRHDPDVIVVGELRDGETAEIAINAALTGHLVLATVHTNTASGAAPRLIDMGVDPALLRSTLRLSVAQRLVRQLCDDCKAPDTPPSGLKSAWKAVGCDQCSGTGYRGRVGVFEFVDMKDELSDILKPGVAASEVEKLARKKKMASIRDDALAKIEAGITSAAEVDRVLGVI